MFASFLQFRPPQAPLMLRIITLASLFLTLTASGFAKEPLDISSAISADIQDIERLSGVDVDVEAERGHVILSGTVTSLLDKHLATRIAKRTRGVQAVMNQTIVKRSQRTDEEIQQDVTKVLRLNDGVERPQITTTVEEGVVSLIGKVDSLAEKRLAELAASGVRGVTGMENQLTVASQSNLTDAEQRDQIAGLLVHSVYLDNVNVQVRVEDSVAILTGTVSSLDQRDAAEQIAEVSGIESIDVDGLSIDPEAGDPSIRAERFGQATSQSIRAAIERSFAADPIVFADTNGIEINVSEGVVTLTGKVTRLAEKMKAKQLALGVVGVVRVVNELKVQRPEEAPSDMEIIRETQAALLRSANLERREIRVHCQRAHVSLYGLVDSELEKKVAGYLAGQVTGVVHVNNSLAVEQKPSLKDDVKIQKDLERKLKYVLLDGAKDVDVTVEDGVAILRGEVDTWRQWQAAIELAIEAGAHHPHNLLNVRFHSPHGASRVYVPR